jgi:NADPH:quinone reductase
MGTVKVTYTPMKIYRVEQPNGDFIEAIAPDPIAKAGEVLIRIHASGVNPLDTKIRAGQAAHARQPLPAVLGLDMAGVVEEVGEGVPHSSGEMKSSA